MAEKDQGERKHKAIGPFAPPLPKTAEREDGGEPMAVARDKQTTDDAFMPTSASLDAFDEDVARRYGPGAHPERTKPTGNSETIRQQSPEGYTEVDEHGFRHLDAEEVEEER